MIGWKNVRIYVVPHLNEFSLKEDTLGKTH